MSYRIKEIFYSLQGEGHYSGRPAVFCRFSGCNLWSGKETERQKSVCRFCDTDFSGTDGPGGGIYKTAAELANKIALLWPEKKIVFGRPLIVCTGGEPLLQLDANLISALHERGFEIVVETNGTIPAPLKIDWLCVSPKAGAELAQDWGDELKLVYPQRGARPEKYAHLNFRYFYLQPMDNRNLQANTQRAIKFTLANPQWRLSIQQHKILNIR